jgi:hypothetical protein
LRLSLPLDESSYAAEQPYAGALFIAGQSDVPVEILLRITAREAR